MTEKQENILLTALELFAENGFDATSTSKVAKAAKVSEGLIFKHFKNKQGLLQAILDLGKSKTVEIFSEIFILEKPLERLRKIISMPFEIDSSQYNFWKLIYALKWQADVYDKSISAPIENALIDIFTTLKYKNPKAEAEVVLILIDGMVTSILLRKPKSQKNVLQSILLKYNL